MDREALRLASSAFNKAHGQGSGRGIKGRGLREVGVGAGRDGGANEGRETCGREGRNAIKTGKREIGGKRGKPWRACDLC